MASKVIVLVADRGDPKHGEVVVLDSAAEAERLVETFLEAGYERGRVRVFAGSEMDAQVSQRPKVELIDKEVDSDADEDSEPPETPGERNSGEPEPRNSSTPPFGASPVPPTEFMPELLQ